MRKKKAIGVDFGGSSSKATLLDADGRVVATAIREYPSLYPRPGWIEQRADDYYDAFTQNVAELLRASGTDPAEIVALAVDAATHMAVLLDEDGRPVRDMIHWSDSRSGEQAQTLRARHGDLIRSVSRNYPSAAWTLPQLMWLGEHEPQALARTRRLCFAKDYVRGRICDNFCTDSIEAMGSMLADDDTLAWDDRLLAIAGLRPDMLPEIKAPVDFAGFVNAQTAARTGLSGDTRVIVGSTDTALEVYASGAIRRGDATVKLATAGRICPVTDGPVPSHQFFNYRHVIPGLWYPGTGTRTCAAAYTWYRNAFGDAEKSRAEREGRSVYEVLDQAAGAVSPGCDSLLFHPYLLGEMTPYYDDRLRASFTGIGIHHRKGHFSRAVLEGAAYSLRDCLEEIRSHAIPMERCRVIGGGARDRLWRQIVADALNLPLLYSPLVDSSLGSAMLAGTAGGMFDGFEDSVERCVRFEEEVRPDPAGAAVYERGFRRYKRVQQALCAAYREADEPPAQSAPPEDLASSGQYKS